MPIYHYTNGKKTVAIFQGMNDEHSYSENGEKFERVWSAPETSVDTKWDALNPEDFKKKTASKKGTLGDLFDKSLELSQQREKKCGKDFVKEQTQEERRKQRGGGLLYEEIKANREKVFRI